MSETTPDVVTEVTITLPGVDRDDLRLDALMDLAMASSDETSFTSTTKPPVDVETTQVPAPTRGKTRRAQITLHSQQLMSLLDLPEGMTVRAVYGVSDPMGIRVVVEGGDLPEVDDDGEAPVIDGAFSTRRWLASDGKSYIRWGWSRDVTAEVTS